MHIAELPIAAGRYILFLSAGTVQDKLIDALDHVIAFDVEAGNFYGNGRTPPPGYGMIRVRSRWSVVADQTVNEIGDRSLLIAEVSCTLSYRCL